ncbi:MAG TPA: glycosyltransferase family 4 protein [Longimicrobium sp.]|nr:glycosyltransferase family 4 protein [Longimicrobium sp.]
MSAPGVVSNAGGDGRLRALFVNSGILGHRSVARVLREAVAADDRVEAEHVDLSEGLTTGDRVVRRLLCAGPRSGASFPGAALTFPRFRAELNAGLLAARRIGALEGRGRRFDVLHFHTQATAWASVARMRATPSVVSIDATQRLASLEAPPSARIDYAPGARADARVFAAAAAIVSPSRWAADDLVAGQPECAGKVHVMPYPVPLEGFDPEWAEERYERTARDPSAPVRVLFVGGDWARKGGPALLAAWREGGFAARARLVLVTAAEVGALPPGVEVRRGVEAYTRAWLDLWREADLFVMPTRGEAFGMVFQEAAAAGLPVVGTAINAVPEIVLDGETGLLVPPGDARALAEAMRALVDSPERRREMGTVARLRIEAIASVEGYAARLGAILRAATEGGAHG